MENLAIYTRKNINQESGRENSGICFRSVVKDELCCAGCLLGCDKYRQILQLIWSWLCFLLVCAVIQVDQELSQSLGFYIYLCKNLCSYMFVGVTVVAVQRLWSKIVRSEVSYIELDPK